MFEKIKCFILDMDGTIYLGNELFPFTKDFLKKVEDTGREYYFFTNNSSKSQRAYIEKLGKLGIQIKKDQMMTSSHVIVKYLKEHYEGKSIYVLGTQSLIQEFQYFDMNLTEEDPDIVVLGFDTTLYSEWLYIFWNQSRLELPNGRRSIYSRLWINSKTYRGFNGKISRILWKTVETYTGLYHPGNGIRTGRDRYCRGPAVYRHRSCRSK
mgnify:CR=1 FL=1